ncbi:MAG: hypothetical protein AAF995_04005 [Planctomycetota bacterium]
MTDRPTRRVVQFRIAAACTAVAAMLAVSGCAPRDINARPVLGGSPAQGLLDTGTPTASTRQRTRSLDRSDWETSVYVVPVDGTVHGPTHRFARTDTGGPRGTGLYPTIATATTLQRSPAKAEAHAALLAPVGALFEFIVMPAGLVLDPPPAQAQSPDRVYKRAAQGGWSSGPVESIGAPPAATEPGS